MVWQCEATACELVSTTKLELPHELARLAVRDSDSATGELEVGAAEEVARRVRVRAMAVSFIFCAFCTG